MLLFLSILGIFLSVILLFFNTRNNKSTIYLGFFFILLSLYIFYQYILVYSKSVFLVSIFIFNLSISSSPLYLTGPMLYWYVRSVLTDDFRLTKKDLLHLLPMLVYFFAALPNAFIPWSTKVEIATEAVNNVGFIQTYKATLLDEIFSVLAIYISRPALVMGYTLWSVGLLFRYSKQQKVSRVFTSQYFMTKWLSLLLGFMLILEITHILLIFRIFALDFSELFFTLNVFRILSLAGLISLLISPFFFPEILYGLPRFPESTIPVNREEGKTVMVTGEGRNNTNHFETEYLNSIGWKADSYMEEVRPYLQPDFNLVHLSVHTQIPVHHLSYYFREEKKQHFNDYKNEWRINHAKNLIRKGKANQLTLETIGLQSGFTSRNTFLTTFKKVEGITPSTFASQVKN